MYVIKQSVTVMFVLRLFVVCVLLLEGVCQVSNHLTRPPAKTKITKENIKNNRYTELPAT